MSGGADDAEARDGSGNAADDKAPAGHGVALSLLQDFLCAFSGDVDCKMGAGIDIDRGLVAHAFAVFGFGGGEVGREHLEHLLLGGTIALLD